MATITKGGFVTLVIIVILAGIGLNKAQVLERNDKPPTDNKQNSEQRVITLRTAWDFPRNRRVIIQYWRDGVKQPIKNYENPWKYKFLASVGEGIGFAVAQPDGGGFLQCTILSDDNVVDYMHLNGTGTCLGKYIVK